MSDGCQANTSTFARRKVTSALSYLGSRVALMVKVPPVPSSLAGTFLVAGGAAIVFLHLPAGLDGASSTAAWLSEETRLPEWASEHLPDLVFLPVELDGASLMAAQYSEDALAGVGTRALAGLGLLLSPRELQRQVGRGPLLLSHP